MRAENPPWWRSLFGHVLPLAFLPAVAWAIGRATGASAPADGAASGFLASIALTVVLSLVSVLLLALAFFLLAPMYDTERNWPRAGRALTLPARRPRPARFAPQQGLSPGRKVHVSNAV